MRRRSEPGQLDDPDAGQRSLPGHITSASGSRHCTRKILNAFGKCLRAAALGRTLLCLNTFNYFGRGFMNPIVFTYIAYLALAVPITLWVGSTLRRNGRVFLLDVFDGDEELAQAVNHLLVVGFYLVNLGFVSIALKTDDPVIDSQSALEALSVKVGTVVLVLGVLHLANLFVLNNLRRRAQQGRATAVRPPMPPESVWSAPVMPG